MYQKRPWAIKICQINGIPVAIHVTFFLLLVWVAIEEIQARRLPFGEVLFVMALFGCVVLHELGHALAAARFGIKTREIALYPFGGVASVLKEATPGAEIIIALAGPAVSCMSALLFYPLSSIDPQKFTVSAQFDFATRLFAANLMLALFNLTPAFPMDGGRILRAVLALAGLKRATEIAACLSQILTVFLAAAALYYGNEILILIAAFVFLNALQEYKRARAMRITLSLKTQTPDLSEEK